MLTFCEEHRYIHTGDNPADGVPQFSPTKSVAGVNIFS